MRRNAPKYRPAGSERLAIGVARLRGCRRPGDRRSYPGCPARCRRRCPPSVVPTGLRTSRIACRANVTTTPGAISRSIVLSPIAATDAVQARGRHDRRADGQGLLQSLGLAPASACAGGPGSTNSTTANRAIRMIGKYCSTTDVPLYRACCSAVGCGPGAGPLGYVDCLGLVHGARATGRDAHGLGRTGCAPALRSLCAEQGL